MRWRKSLYLIGFVGLAMALVAPPAGAASSGPAPQVFYPTRADVSAPLRSIKPLPPRADRSKEMEIVNRAVPKPAGKGSGVDRTVQNFFGAPNTPAPLLSVEGLANADNQTVLGGRLAPPDTEGDVGPNHFFQWVNLVFAIWDKSGNKIYPVQPGPPAAAGNTFWFGFGGACETDNDGDPIVLYDRFADRWLVSQFSSSSPYRQCIAVSVNGDPTGSWYRYEYIFNNNKFPDYPKWGVWPDAYYTGFNQFLNLASWSGAGAIAWERAKMLTGDPTAAAVYFDLYGVNPNFGNMFPAHFEGTTPPPVGAPGLFAEWDDSTWLGDAQDTVRIWQFHVDWSNPANSTFGLGGLPNELVAVADVDPSLCGFSRDCIPQPGTTQKLDTLSDRLMYRIQYRNFGTYQTLVMNQSVDADGTDHAGIHFRELRNSGTGWSEYQAGTYAPDASHRWMGSAAMDASGNIGIGYSVSDATAVYPSARYTGRLASDPLGQLGDEQVLVAGGGSQTSVNRWGDYSTTSIDPSDDCTFWTTQEYVAAPGGSWVWNTRFGSFRFPSCVSGPSGTIQGTVTSAATGDPLAGVLISAGAYSTTTNASGVYSFAVAPGTYDVTASLFGYAPVTAAGVVVNEGDVLTQDFQLSPVGSAVVDGYVVAAGHGWPLYAKLEISVLNGPTQTVYTDPATGYYEVTLNQGYTYNFHVTAVYPGYTAQDRPVFVGPADQVQSFTLEPSADCIAWGFAPSYFWYADFEANNGGFTVSGTTSWAWGTPASGPGAAHSGSKVWATNLAGNYNNSENGYITSPAIDLSGHAGERVVIEWFQWLRSESGYDYASVEATKDGGATWQTFYGPVSGAIDATAWAKRQAILPADFAVANFQLRFHFLSDSSVTYPGWYVDDVGIFTQAAPVPTVKFSKDFEADNGGFAGAGTNSTWAWGAPTSGPGAAHSGNNAWATNLAGNYNNSENSTLTSPVIDLSGETGKSITLSWWQFLQTESCCDPVSVEVTADGIAWTTVYGPVKGSIDLAWTQHSVTLTDAYATAAFQFRFHFTSDSSVTYPGWYIDDVAVSTSDPIPPPVVLCVPVGGTILFGFVNDANVGTRINGATVANDVGGSAVTVADANLGDGFYALYTAIPGLGPSTRTFTASKDGYGDDVKQINLVPNSAMRQDFSLGAGWLVVTPTSLTSRLYTGQEDHQSLNVLNQGSLLANFAFSLVPIIPTWPHHSPVVANTPASVSSTARAPHATYPNPATARPNLALAAVPAYGVDLIGGSLVNWADVTVPAAWSIVAPAPGSYFAGAFLSGDFSKLYVLDYDTNELKTIDTASGAVTVIGPANPNGQSWTGLTTTGDGTMYASSTTCGASTLFTVNPATGATTAVGAITNGPCIIDISANAAGEIYGVDIVNDVLVKIDPATGAGTVIGPTGIDANYAQGLCFDTTTGTLYWAAYNNAAGGELRVIDTTTGASTLVGPFPGGTEVDAFAIQSFTSAGLPWLVLTPEEGAVSPGDVVPVDAHFIADGAPHFGLFRATIKTNHDTPYDVNDVTVNFTKAFNDIPAGYWADAYIHGLAGARVVWGEAGGVFGPTHLVTRDEIAMVLERAYHGADFVPPAATGIFLDVTPDNPYAPWIEQLYNDGITTGCPFPNYCPNRTMTRAEYSVFLIRATRGASFVPPPPVGLFSDVPTTYWAAAWIEQLYNDGITTGCAQNPLRYCPEGTVNRAEMATFLVRAFNIPYLH